MHIDKILICRTDNIGDVVLSLPMLALLKQHWPDCHISMLTRAYTKSIIDACPLIDSWINWDLLQKDPAAQQLLRAQNFTVAIQAHANCHAVTKLIYKAKIPMRIGRGRHLAKRLYLSHRLESARRTANLHEAQLNVGLLQPLGIECQLPAAQLYQLMPLSPAPLPSQLQNLLDPNRFKLVLHPFSNGSAREWPLKKFMALSAALNPQHYQIIITGSTAEAKKLASAPWHNQSNLTNLCGKINLMQLLSLLQNVNGIVTNSTGPLHMAAALGCNSLGLFPKSKGIGMQRWHPIGCNAQALATNRPCPGKCSQHACACMQSISVQTVQQQIQTWFAQYTNLEKPQVHATTS